MVELRETEAFIEWRSRLRDPIARKRIDARLFAIQTGHLGDWAPVGDGVNEFRIHVGPGYRIYFMRIGDMVVVLLGGGDKATQTRDIAKAKDLARSIREDLA